VINVHTEFYGGYNKELALAQIERIYEVCLDILARSAQENRSSQEVAVRLAEQRIAAMKHARLG
jgi:glutamate dehydrogenase/leucine dehydrogenase